MHIVYANLINGCFLCLSEPNHLQDLQKSLNNPTTLHIILAPTTPSNLTEALQEQLPSNLLQKENPWNNTYLVQLWDYAYYPGESGELVKILMLIFFIGIYSNNSC